ncbi:MAG: hypothetical protein DMG78_05720 [Acidobacteria bacterium]|nr:MAG: hypothetical protein DMG78_05720 [Acidobacteriota bacterium]
MITHRLFRCAPFRTACKIQTVDFGSVVGVSREVAIVTGASKGIGAGIAKALGAAGARVAVNYSSDREGAERVVQPITDNGGGNRGRGDVAKALAAAFCHKEGF